MLISMTNAQTPEMTGPSTAEWTRMLFERSGPLLTWYSTGRVELSGPVLARWIAKVDNFLGSEFAFGESTFHLDLPNCWQRTVWEAALLLRGWAETNLADADLVVSDNVETLRSGAALGVVTLAQPTDPLGLRWDGELPAGVTDAPGELLAQSDLSEYSLQSGPLWAFENHLLAGLPTPPGRVFLQSPGTQKLLQLWGNGGSALIVDSWQENQERTRDLLKQEKVSQVLA